MTSWGKIDCTLTVPLGGNGTHSVNRQELAAWLRKIAGDGRSRAASQVEAVAAAVEAADGDVAVAHVVMSAEDAEGVIFDVDKLLDRAMNPAAGLSRGEVLSHRAAAYGLHRFRRAWVDCTGWNQLRRARDSYGAAVPGSGYAR